MYTLFNGNVCNKKCSLDSDVKVVQRSNINGSTCSTGSKCGSRPLVLITSTMAAVVAAMTLQSSEHNVNSCYDDCATSNNHTILALNELVGCGGSITSPAKRTGTMCLSGAMLAVCLVFFMYMIKRVFETVSWYVGLFEIVFLSWCRIDINCLTGFDVKNCLKNCWKNCC